jgi:hypothetical protein
MKVQNWALESVVKGCGFLHVSREVSVSQSYCSGFSTWNIVVHMTMIHVQKPQPQAMGKTGRGQHGQPRSHFQQQAPASGKPREKPWNRNELPATASATLVGESRASKELLDANYEQEGELITPATAYLRR